MAVVLIQESIWLDQQQTLCERLQRGHFFEHLGLSASSKGAADSRHWKEEDIKQILAVEEVGWTTVDWTNIREVFRSILYNYKTKIPYYNALWWNCHDVAIFFAHLIDESDVSAQKLPRLYLLLMQLRQQLLEEGKEILNGYVAKGAFGSALVAKTLATFGATGFTSLAGGGILISNPWGLAVGASIFLAAAVPNVWENIHNMIASRNRRVIVNHLQERYARLKEIDEWVKTEEDDDDGE
ncbi:hypothetical protein IFR05_014047 [Cadophora sp. M221]|nr:hypothetical protein IFR05_014047 [Cadophora sp. M221]